MDCKKKTLIALVLITALTFQGCKTAVKRSHGAGIRPKAATATLKGKADECGIWADQKNPKNSVLIGNDKSSSGALYVWNVDGEQIFQTPPIDQPVGVSIRYDVALGKNQKVDVVACGVRSTNEIKIFQIDKKTRHLIDLTTEGGISSGFPDKTYGLCLYKRSSDGQLFAFVSRKETDNIHQIQIDPDGKGKFKGTLIRKFGKKNQRTFVEGMVADDEHGYLYCSDERFAILKFSANPKIKKDPYIKKFGVADNIRGDREGLGLYRKKGGRGYLVVSSQGDSSFKIYNREGKNKFIKSINLPGVTKTDGIGITALKIPPKYPNGIFAAHNDKDNNYVLFDWYEFSRLK